MKEIVVILNNFYPELSSLAQLYTDLCTELAKEYSLKVICAVPSYTGDVEEKYSHENVYYEKYKDIKIYRVRVSGYDKANKISRVKSILGYFYRVVMISKKFRKIDLIIAVSQPPIIGGIIGTLYKKQMKCPLIYNIQDYNPEQIEAVDYSKNKLLINMLKMIDIASCRNADVVSVVSKEMKETLNQRFRGINVPKCVSISNWVNEKEIVPLSHDHPRVKQFREKYGFINKVVYMYSGNIGLIYDLENIIRTILRLSNVDDVLFAFVGQGNMKKRLENIVEVSKAKNVVFIPYQKNEEIIYSLNAADVHFVFSAKGMKGVASPSKLYGVMAVGKPIIGMLEKGMESREIIEKSNCGFVANPGQYDLLADYIIQMRKNKSLLPAIGDNGRKYYCRYLGRDNSINQYKELISGVIRG